MFRHSFVLCMAMLVSAVGCRANVTSQPLQVGSIVPPLELKSVSSNEKFAIDSLKGDFVIVNFWSTTCSVCMQEIDDLKEIHNSGKVKVIGVALDDDRERIKSVIQKRDVHYPVLQGDQATFERFDGYSIPYTLVLDREQVVLKRFFGRMSEQDLEEALAAAPSVTSVASFVR